jgi:hypothetical protein
MESRRPFTPAQCYERAQICLDMAKAQFNPHARKQFEDLAKAWNQVRAELERIEDIKKEWTWTPVKPPF